MNKAWQITVADLSEPWYYQDIIVYAETGDKAKAIAWAKDLSNIRDAEFLHCNRDICYTDLRAHRIKDLDKVEWKGSLVSESRLKELKWVEKRDEDAKKLVEEFPDKTAVVWNGSYNSYWGANRSGYSSTLKGAGLYSTQEAYDIVKGSCFSRKETVRLCSKEEVNKEIDSEIDKLKNEIKRLESFKFLIDEVKRLH